MQAHWDRFARQDPLHAILAIDHPLSTDEFLKGGAPIVQDMMAWAFHDLPSKDRLLEIGCGMGRTAAHFARAFQRVDAVDVSPTMVARARETCPAEYFPNLHFHAVPGDSLSLFPNASFNAAFSFLVFQHIPDARVIRALLQEVARLLTPDGRAVLQFDTRPEPLATRLYKALPDWVLPRKHRRFMRRYRRNAAALRSWCTAAGLRVLRERDPGTDTHFLVLTRA